MADEEPNGVSIPDEVPDDVQNIVLTEYRQAGEEVRNRDRLIHNAYYIFITVSAVLLWQLTRVGFLDGKKKQSAVLLIGGGVLYMFLGFVIVEHFRKRRSAMALRDRVEMIFAGTYEDELSGEDVNEYVTYPLSLQHNAGGRGIVWDADGNDNTEKNDEDSERGDEADANCKRLLDQFSEFHSFLSDHTTCKTLVGAILVIVALGALNEIIKVLTPSLFSSFFRGQVVAAVILVVVALLNFSIHMEINGGDDTEEENGSEDDGDVEKGEATDAGFEKAPGLFREFFSCPSNRISAKALGQVIFVIGFLGVFDWSH